MTESFGRIRLSHHDLGKFKEFLETQESGIHLVVGGAASGKTSCMMVIAGLLCEDSQKVMFVTDEISKFTETYIPVSFRPNRLPRGIEEGREYVDRRLSAVNGEDEQELEPVSFNDRICFVDSSGFELRELSGLIEQLKVHSSDNGTIIIDYDFWSRTKKKDVSASSIREVTEIMLLIRNKLVKNNLRAFISMHASRSPVNGHSEIIGQGNMHAADSVMMVSKLESSNLFKATVRKDRSGKIDNWFVLPSINAIRNGNI